MTVATMVGCGSSNIHTTTPIQTKPPTQSETQTQSYTPKYTLILSVSPAEGGSVKIANPPEGEFSYDSLDAIAEIQSNYSNSYDSGTQLILYVKASEGYVFESWSGDLSGNSEIAYINIESNMSIVANFGATATETTLPTITYFEVSANTILSSNSLSIGENLTIHTEIEYIGDESTITGVPTIMVISSNFRVVAHWSLDEQDNIYINTGPMEYFEIEKGKKYIMHVTWDLIDLFTHANIPSGEYTIQATIAIPYQNGFSPLITNEHLSITIL